ncbi:pectate lyase, partial [Dactylosporangium sp. NPDC005555]|uniref:pectate lyase n=1 Tax=Dactylosporangium sp. NPDC005555 TaxID=3154889 RepID=UPI0033A18A34
AGDGIHCLGTCTIQNVWWEDVGEDAATFLGTSGGTSYVIGGGARSASDKVFQHNGNGTVNISGFYVENAGKLYRACGNCTNSYQRNVVVDNIIARSTKVIAGINTNWGDTARFTRITVYGSATICDKYKGAPKGSEPTHIGSGADGVNCFYNASDITYR